MPHRYQSAWPSRSPGVIAAEPSASPHACCQLGEGNGVGATRVSGCQWASTCWPPSPGSYGRAGARRARRFRGFTMRRKPSPPKAATLSIPGDMSPTCRVWLAQTGAGNFGWMLVCGDELTPAAPAGRFQRDPANAPSLVIEYTQPCRQMSSSPPSRYTLFEFTPDNNLGVPAGCRVFRIRPVETGSR